MGIRFKSIAAWLHLWLGLSSGLVVFIVSLTGALYVFSEDINSWLNRDFTDVPVQNTPLLSPERLNQIGEKFLRDRYGPRPAEYWNWKDLTIPNRAGKSVQFSARKYDNPNITPSVYMNPYTGQVLRAGEHGEAQFWRIVVDLHTTLMLGDVGVWVVEISTLVFLVLVVSGLVLWWPKNRAARKQRFWFRWKETMKWKRKNYDLHNILGFYTCWIVIFMIITGLGWSFSWFATGIHTVLGGDVSRREPVVVPMAAGPAPSSVLNNVYNETRRRYPTAYSYRIETSPYHADGEPLPKNKPLLVLVFSTEHYAYNSTIYFHPRTGAFLGQLTFRDKTAAEKYDDLSGDIHYGWIFGWPSKIAVFFACLIAASLPFTGFYIWWGRYRRGRRRDDRTGELAVSRTKALPINRPIYRAPVHSDKPVTD